MAIEWEETVETKQRVRLDVTAPGQLRHATIDDLRRACEAVGGYQFHDWEAVHAICDEHGISRETMGLDAQMMRPALARERVRALVVKLTEQEEQNYHKLTTAEAERVACLDALSEHVSPDATADTPRMVRPSSVLAGIRSLQGRLRDARSDLREHDAALEAAERRRSSEVTGLGEQLAEVVAQRDALRARLETAERLHSEAEAQVECRNALRYRIASLEADLTAARDRIAELEAPLPEATVEELGRAYRDGSGGFSGQATVFMNGGIRAVAERVRRERPPCLIARAVAGGANVLAIKEGDWWYVQSSVPLRRASKDSIPADEVPAELARMLTEVGA